VSRVFTSGFEFTDTAGLATAAEWVSANVSGLSIVSTNVHSGIRGLKLTTLTSGAASGVVNQFANTSQSGAFWFRKRVRVDVAPPGETTIILLGPQNTGDVNGGARRCSWITIDNTRTLRLYTMASGIATQITGTVQMTLQTHQRIEIHHHATGGTVAARLDGVDFASASGLTLATMRGVAVGGNLLEEALSGACDITFDDGALNNSIGTAENSWPGEGRVVVLRADAAGANTQWTPSAGLNWQAVDDDIPDEDTTYVQSNTAEQIDDYGVTTPAAIGASDTIKFVTIVGRFRGLDAAGTNDNALFKYRITANGVTEELPTAVSVDPATVSWRLGTDSPNRHDWSALTLYDLPGASTSPWTKALLDSAQIGVRTTLAATGATRLTALYLIVEYTPAGPVTVPASADLLAGARFDVTGEPVQQVYPANDIAAGGWLQSGNNTGVALYTMVDEPSNAISDADYIYAPVATSTPNVVILQLAPALDAPDTTPRRIRVRAGKDLAGGDIVLLRFSLINGDDGATIGAQQTATLTETFTDYIYTLPSLAGVTNRSNLHIRIEQVKGP
jgi:hypothetical protein